MPQRANVFIYYGPYKSNGTVEHRVDRIIGLKSYLELKGHKVTEIKKNSFWNNLELVVNGEHVFKCRVEDLDFGGDGELDDLVLKAENAVAKAF